VAADEPLVLRSMADNGVLTLLWNRPDRYNAWNQDLAAAYAAALEEAADDPDVRVVVVSGAGRHFCPGADIEALASAAGGRAAPSGPSGAPGSHPGLLALSLPKPLVAAVRGMCAGGGLAQALLCDVRFVARDATLSTAFARRGLAAEHALSWSLPRVVGRAQALELLLSARKFDGEEAHRLGLATFLSDAETVLADAQAYAGRLATLCSPRSMATIRHQVLADDARSFEEAWDDAAVRARQLLADVDAREGAASFAERRDPRFAPLPSGFRVAPRP
jgi:enoyl-CoA hydratase/carnithine racemase